MDTTSEDALGTEDDELEFRLFSAPSITKDAEPANAVQKIRLASPSVDHSNAGFVQPDRDPSYYFTNGLSEAVKDDLHSVALTGQQIHALARQPWPGSAYEWKVLHLPPSSMSEATRQDEAKCFTSLVSDAPVSKRKRPGKKYRIKLRRKHAEAETRKAAVEAAAASKETRYARKSGLGSIGRKKARKRARDKAKKVAAATEEGTESGPHAVPTDTEIDAG